MRYHKDCKERGRYYMLLAHGASEEMAKATIAAEAAKKRRGGPEEIRAPSQETKNRTEAS